MTQEDTALIQLQSEIRQLEDRLYHRNPNKQGSILFVDDDTRLHMPFRKTFFNSFNVFCADGASEALNIISREHIDVAIIDMVMPEIKGDELIDIIRKFNPEIPLIVYTAFHEDYDEKSLKEKFSIFEYFRKPGTIKDLLESAKQAAAKYNVQLVEKTTKPNTFKLSVARKISELKACPLGIIYTNDSIAHGSIENMSLQNVADIVGQNCSGYCSIGTIIQNIAETKGTVMCSQLDISHSLVIEGQTFYSCRYLQDSPEIINNIQRRKQVWEEVQSALVEA